MNGFMVLDHSTTLLPSHETRNTAAELTLVKYMGSVLAQ